MTASKSPTTRQAAEGTKAPSTAGRRRAPSQSLGGPGADLLALQAKIGNRAVGRMLGVGSSAAPRPVAETLARDGRALDPSLRGVMEARLGADLGAVRVHTDSRSSDSARAIGAKAYASGHHVVFGPDRFAPETADGARLLTHELTHVVQQGANTFPAPAASLAAPAMHPAGSPAEREASARSTSDSRGRPAHAVPAGSVMREPEGEKSGTESKGVLETILGGVIGDFNQDPSMAEIAINTGVGLIPVVGEVTAVRDVAANAYWMDKKSDYTSPSLWMGMVFALISLFPEIGAALKGLGKSVVKGAGAAIRPILHLVESVLAKLGHSEGLLSFFRKHWGQAVAAGMGLFDKVMAKLSSLLSRAVKFVSSKAESLARGLERIREAAGKLLQPAIDKAKNLFEDVLERFGQRIGHQAEGAGAKVAEGGAVKSGASTAVKDSAPAAANAGSVATIQGTAKPGPGQALVGSSRSQMRRAARKIISVDPDHPLHFLLDKPGKTGKFKPQKGLGHAELMDRPDLVQMGHIASDKLGGQERLMLQGAWENQFLSQTIEQSHIGGAVLSQEAIDIGGVAVEKQTAVFWEKIGWLKDGTVAKAPKIL